MPLSVSDDSCYPSHRYGKVHDFNSPRIKIHHYGMMGLEGYNLLKGTKFEFDGVEKYQIRTYEVGSYKIFFKAHMDQSPPTTFCTLVDLGERSADELDLGFPIATQINENGEFIESVREESDDEYESQDEYFRKLRLLDWPRERVLNDNEVQVSEFQDHKILLYLGMVYCGDNKCATTRQFDDLNIVKVAVRTEPYPESMCKYFYIVFEDIDGRTGARIKRKAIVRRFINNSTGYLTLTGRIFSGEKEKEAPSSSGNSSPKLSIRQRSFLKLAESGGFDIEDDSICHRSIRMSSYSNPEWFKDGHSKVILYAKAGLHRYNILKGTRLELSALIKFNKTMNCVSSYYITLVARDLDAAAGSKEETFQVRVDEKTFGNLDMTVSVARRKDETGTSKNKMPFIPHFHADGVPASYKRELPKWPSKSVLMDQNRFYMANESEIQDNDWIRLYLELAVCVDGYGRTTKTDLAKLQITNVAIEALVEVDPPSERLNAKSAHFFITYKGWFKQESTEAGEMEGKATIRRVLSEKIGYLTLLGRVTQPTPSKKRKRKKAQQA